MFTTTPKTHFGKEGLITELKMTCSETVIFVAGEAKDYAVEKKMCISIYLWILCHFWVNPATIWHPVLFTAKHFESCIALIRASDGASLAYQQSRLLGIFSIWSHLLCRTEEQSNICQKRSLNDQNWWLQQMELPEAEYFSVSNTVYLWDILKCY